MASVAKALMRYVLLAAVLQLFAPLFLSGVTVHKACEAKYYIDPTTIFMPSPLKQEEEIKYEEYEQREATLLLDLSGHYFNLNSFHQSDNFSFLNYPKEGQPSLFTRHRAFLI
jgi:hypothetical protein